MTAMGGQIGVDPLPVGLIVVTQYVAGERWRPRPLSAGQALLALMDNTVAAQGDPSHSMPILREALLGATCIQSKRGEASRVAQALLKQLQL